jgi:hypothetical protein
MKKSISSILSFVVFNFAMVLVGFLPAAANTGIIGIEQSNGTPMVDNIAGLRIAIPTQSMFRKADREIHMNMYNDIRSAFQISFSPTILAASDRLINDQFESTYQIALDLDQTGTADDMINQSFVIEQLTYNSIEQISNGDDAMTISFYGNN